MQNNNDKINGFSTDMDVANWLDDYVQDRLSDQKKAHFEAFILDKPELLEQVKLGLAMRQGFKTGDNT